MTIQIEFGDSEYFMDEDMLDMDIVPKGTEVLCPRCHEVLFNTDDVVWENFTGVKGGWGPVVKPESVNVKMIWPTRDACNTAMFTVFHEKCWFVAHLTFFSCDG